MISESVSTGFKNKSIIPPAISAIPIIKLLVNKLETAEPISSPNMAVGTKPTIIFGIRDKFPQSVLEKNTTAAKTAPLCIEMTKALKKPEAGIA